MQLTRGAERIVRRLLLAGWVVGLLATAPRCSPLPAFDAQCTSCDVSCPQGLECQFGMCTDPDDLGACASAIPDATPACVRYCETVLTACPFNYQNVATCVSVCEHLPEGDADNPTAVPNSVACRHDAAIAALDAEPSERETLCPAAGPGGDGRCGTNCESFCVLLSSVCKGGTHYEVSDCMRKCEAFNDAAGFDVSVDDYDNTVQCRLVDVSASTLPSADTEEQCERPYSAGCGVSWTCEAYCQVQGIACTGDFAIYESDAQCMATCNVIDSALDEFETSFDEGWLPARGQAALEALEWASCSRASPTGGCACDLGAAPYCGVAREACPDEFAATWNHIEECFEDLNVAECECSGTSYSVSTAESGDPLDCRILHAIRALDGSDKANNCAAAFGGSPCN